MSTIEGFERDEVLKVIDEMRKLARAIGTGNEPFLTKSGAEFSLKPHAREIERLANELDKLVSYVPES